MNVSSSAASSIDALAIGMQDTARALAMQGVRAATDIAADCDPQFDHRFDLDLGNALSPEPAYAIPHEIWGEIASFSVRQDVLNLRSVSRELQDASDTAITTMTLTGNACLRSFADAIGFAHIQRLRLKDMDSDGIQYFVERFSKGANQAFPPQADTRSGGSMASSIETHRAPCDSDSRASTGPGAPRRSLTLELIGSDLRMARSIVMLSRLPLAELHIQAAYMGLGAIDALSACGYPVMLASVLAPEKLLAASRIATLTTLDIDARFFDDDTANLFSDHPALENLICLATFGFSSRGAECIASVPKLRTLDLDLLSGVVITPSVASALAAKPTLRALRLRTQFQPLSAAIIGALASSETLQTLWVDGISHPLRRNVAST